jgi:hypothetical protein
LLYVLSLLTAVLLLILSSGGGHTRAPVLAALVVNRYPRSVSF